jgi:hypothetical protein
MSVIFRCASIQLSNFPMSMSAAACPGLIACGSFPLFSWQRRP